MFRSKLSKNKLKMNFKRNKIVKINKKCFKDNCKTENNCNKIKQIK